MDLESMPPFLLIRMVKLLSIIMRVLRELQKSKKAFAKILEAAIDPSKNDVVIGLVESSESVLGGSYDTEQIDVDDMAKATANGEFATTQGLLAHEIAEQTEKQTVTCEKEYSNELYLDAHNNSAIPAENSVNGSTRIGRWKGSKFSINKGKLSGTYGVVYKNKKGHGVVLWTIKNNNVIKMSQQYGKLKKTK